MNNISLIKVTGFVVTVALASSFVNAEDKINTIVEEAQSDVVKVEKQLSFPTLIEELDTDKNGMLSQTEVSATHSKVLKAEFNKMDTNQDKQIDEAEFNRYLAEVKDKATTIAKSDA